jgi:hypothetical protein
MTMEYEGLHVYAAQQWHDEACIVGTRKGLEVLRDALNAALADADGVAAGHVFANDGEGYFVHVHAVTDAEFDRMNQHYTDRDLFNPNGRAGCMWPHQLPRQPQQSAPDNGQRRGAG